MITNKGKEIVAKYLLGTAPAYASYIALGCGAKPRPSINSISSVSSSGNQITVGSTTPLWVGAKITLTSQETVEISDSATVGSISGSGPWVATLTGLTTTAGLTVGSKITATPGTGSLGGGTGGLYTVKTIVSTTSITYDAVGGTTPTAGTISDLKYGTGQLSSIEDTIVTSITNTSTFTVDPAPNVDLYNATISIQTDPALEVLDFEMFRIPITSRGYVNDNGINKVVLTAELPTEERYEISEVGIFSAGANSSAGNADSKTITAFSGTENWQFNTGTTLTSPPEIINISAGGNLTTTQDCFQTTADNTLFLNSPTRLNRYETCRYFNNIYMLRGNTGLLTGSAGSFVKQTGSKFLQITNQSVDLSRNSSSDLLKIVFSLIAVDGSGSVVPEKIKILLEFSNGDGTQFARLEKELTTSDYLTNRYILITKRLDELVYSTIFDWKEVSVIRVYASTIDDVATTNKQANGTTATITTAAHGIPVNASVTNAIGAGGIVTYTAVNTFSPGDIVTITGVNPSAYNLSNQTVTESDGTSFKVNNSATGTYVTGGTAIIQNARVTITGVNGTDSGFDGTFTLTSVPSTTQIVYARTGTVVGSTGIVGNVDIYRQNYYLGLDAIRFDNIATINPLYGMTGYSIIQNTGADAIIKGANTSNYIEYRFILDVT